MKYEDQQKEGIQPYLKVRIGNTGLAVPLPKVWMILHGQAIDPVAEAPESVLGKVYFSNGPVPVLDPEKSLSVEAGKIDRQDSSLLLMTLQEHYFGLPVDAIEGIDKISSRHIHFDTAEINRETIHIVDPEKLLTSKDMQSFLEVNA